MVGHVGWVNAVGLYIYPDAEPSGLDPYFSDCAVDVITHHIGMDAILIIRICYHCLEWLENYCMYIFQRSMETTRLKLLHQLTGCKSIERWRRIAFDTVVWGERAWCRFFRCFELCLTGSDTWFAPILKFIWTFFCCERSWTEAALVCSESRLWLPLQSHWSERWLRCCLTR